MQSFEEADQRGDFRRGKILPVSRHISAALQHLPHQLVVGQPGRDSIERRTALATHASEHMAIAALLVLEDNLSLSPQGCGIVHIALRYGVAAPRLHLRTPGCVGSQVLANRKGYRQERDREHSDRPAVPALFSLTGKKRKRQQKADSQYRRNQDEGRLQVLGEKRENGVNPQEEEIRLGNGLNDRGIRKARRPERSQDQRARRDRKKDGCGKDHVSP